MVTFKMVIHASRLAGYPDLLHKCKQNGFFEDDSSVSSGDPSMRSDSTRNRPKKKRNRNRKRSDSGSMLSDDCTENSSIGSVDSLDGDFPEFISALNGIEEETRNENVVTTTKESVSGLRPPSNPGTPNFADGAKKGERLEAGGGLIIEDRLKQRTVGATKIGSKEKQNQCAAYQGNSQPVHLQP